MEFKMNYTPGIGRNLTTLVDIVSKFVQYNVKTLPYDRCHSHFNVRRTFGRPQRSSFKKINKLKSKLSSIISMSCRRSRFKTTDNWTTMNVTYAKKKYEKTKSKNYNTVDV